MNNVLELKGKRFVQASKNGMRGGIAMNGKVEVSTEHLLRLRVVQQALTPNWREGNGRKPEKEKVRAWRAAHPESTNKSQCARDLGLSRPTVRKWWEASPDENDREK